MRGGNLFVEWRIGPRDEGPGWQASLGMTVTPAKSPFCPIATERDCRLVDERLVAD
jgi:hypothetical protein